MIFFIICGTSSQKYDQMDENMPIVLKVLQESQAKVTPRRFMEGGFYIESGKLNLKQ